jgi:hypothetical protein
VYKIPGLPDVLETDAMKWDKLRQRLLFLGLPMNVCSPSARAADQALAWDARADAIDPDTLQKYQQKHDTRENAAAWRALWRECQ